MKKIIKTVIVIGVIGLFTASCTKNDYFINSGDNPNKMDGSVMDYLEGRPLYFDTLVQVIHLAGMDQVFEKDSITFFAPIDFSIVSSVTSLNNYLRLNGRDTVSDLSQISQTTWRKMLSLYLFQGEFKQKDFPQIDTMAILAYPGQNYASYDGRPMNIGVIYHNTEDVKYAGYRQLLLSYIKDFSKPKHKNIHVLVSSADIKEENGVVHTLQFENHYFGFDTTQFILSALNNGITNK